MLCRASADIEATATNIVPNCLASFISWLQKRQSSVVMFAADFVRLCVRLPAVNCTKGSTTIPQMSLLTPPSAPPTTETTNEFSTSSNGRRNNTTSKHKTLAYLEVCERNVNRQRQSQINKLTPPYYPDDVGFVCDSKCRERQIDIQRPTARSLTCTVTVKITRKILETVWEALSA